MRSSFNRERNNKNGIAGKMKAMNKIRCLWVGFVALGFVSASCIAAIDSSKKSRISLHISGAEMVRIPLSLDIVGHDPDCGRGVIEIKQGLRILGSFDVKPTATYAKLHVRLLGKKKWTLSYKQLDQELVMMGEVPCDSFHALDFLSQVYERITHVRKITVVDRKAKAESGGVKDFFFSKVAFVGEWGPKKKRKKSLFMMNLNGSQFEKLVPKKDFVLFPVFSPSGKYLSFVSFEKYGRSGVRPELFVLETASRKLRRVFAQWDTGIGSAVFHPLDERVLIFSLRKKGKNRGLYQVHMDKPNRAVPLKYRFGFDVEPTIDPTGRVLAFSSLRTGKPMIYTLPMAVTDRREFPVRLTYVGRYNSSPAFGPGGQWIVFASDQRNNFDLFKIRPSGDELFRITQTPLNEEAPRFSPFSPHHIVFARRAPYGKAGSTLRVMHIGFPGVSAALRVPFRRLAIKTPSWSGVLDKKLFRFERK